MAGKSEKGGVKATALLCLSTQGLVKIKRGENKHNTPSIVLPNAIVAGGLQFQSRFYCCYRMCNDVINVITVSDNRNTLQATVV